MSDHIASGAAPCALVFALPFAYNPSHQPPHSNNNNGPHVRSLGCSPNGVNQGMKLLALITALLIALIRPLAAQDMQAGYEAYVRGDYAAALKHFRPLAEQGYAGAQAPLGLMYATGQGLPKDNVMAFVWLTAAVQNGDQTAPRNLKIIITRLNEIELQEARALAKRCIKNLKSCPK